MTNAEKYSVIFKNIFEVTTEQLNDEFTFKNVDKWDSLTHLTLISELEETFDIMFETEDILRFGSYFNGIEILKRYGVKF